MDFYHTQIIAGNAYLIENGALKYSSAIQVLHTATCVENAERYRDTGSHYCFVLLDFYCAATQSRLYTYSLLRHKCRIALSPQWESDATSRPNGGSVLTMRTACSHERSLYIYYTNQSIKRRLPSNRMSTFNIQI